MRNVMECLLPGFDMSGIDKFRDDLRMKATEKRYDIEAGWNVDILNRSMFSLLKGNVNVQRNPLEGRKVVRQLMMLLIIAQKLLTKKESPETLNQQVALIR